jgi:hypothetical protein
MDGFKKCTSRPAPSVCRFLQQNLPTTEVAQFFAQETAERPSDLADAMTLVA